MKLTPELLTVILLVLLELFIPSTKCCMTKTREVAKKKEPPTTTKPTIKPIAQGAAEISKDESLYSKYAKYASSGFYMEIEESRDKTVKVHKLKELPPIYSQIIANDTSTVSLNGNGTESENVTSTTIPPPTEPPTTVEPLSPEDAAVRADWGGECLASHWKYCNQVTKITVMNVFTQIQGKDVVWQHLDLDCLIEPIVCLRNGWTVNRCHILCMSKCNREILLGWDKLVSYEGQCKYVRR